MVKANPVVELPPIPAKRYFTIGEVSDLCGVKPHVLRYWEQEFAQLRPMKRAGNRRYYQHHEVLLVRRIRQLLYDEGFTISGARNRLDSMGRVVPQDLPPEPEPLPGLEGEEVLALRAELQALADDLQAVLDGARRGVAADPG